MARRIYSPAQEKLFELALPVLLTKPFEQVSPNTNSENKCFDPPCSVPLHSATLRALYARDRVNNKKTCFLLRGTALGTLEAL